MGAKKYEKWDDKLLRLVINFDELKTSVFPTKK